MNVGDKMKKGKIKITKITKCQDCMWRDRNADVLFCPFHNCVRKKKVFEASKKNVNKNAD